MSEVPPFVLTPEQAQRLLTYMREYRVLALASLPPTSERNTTLRLVQALQGKLQTQCTHESTPQVPLPVNQDDIAALKQMAASLLRLYGNTAASAERTKIVTDLGCLYAYLKQVYR